MITVKQAKEMGVEFVDGDECQEPVTREHLLKLVEQQTTAIAELLKELEQYRKAEPEFKNGDVVYIGRALYEVIGENTFGSIVCKKLGWDEYKGFHPVQLSNIAERIGLKNE